MRILGTLFALACLAVLLAGAAFAYVTYQFSSTGPHTDTRYVLIDTGSSVRDIASTLRQDGVMTDVNATVFPYIARFDPSGQTLKAGEYEISAGMSAREILRLMQEGKVVQRQITIPEGWTSAEIIEHLNNLEHVAGEPITDIPPEGSILPESFAYSRNQTRQDILKRMQDDMQALLDEAWENRVSDLPLKSKEEALVLASIIEKETGVSSEREKVSGVFINRLNQGMLLQTDPTVIYALTEGKTKLGRPLYLKDLKVDHPYNTYVYAGLPPGPIANPGKASILAAVNPAKHNYTYFVADGSGGHAFAEDLAGHNRNVAAWRKIQRARSAETTE